MELIGFDKTSDWRVLWWLSSTAQKRVQSEVEGKRRELSCNGTCTTWCRVLRFHDQPQYYVQSSMSGRESVLNHIFGRIKLWEEKDGAQNQGGVKESATAMWLEQSNSFTRSMTQKDSNRITYNSTEKAVSSFLKRENQRVEKKKLCLKLAERKVIAQMTVIIILAGLWNVQSAELDVWASKNLSKNHEDLHYHWDRNWDLLKRGCLIRWTTNRSLSETRRTNGYWLSSQPIERLRSNRC